MQMKRSRSLSLILICVLAGCTNEAVVLAVRAPNGDVVQVQAEGFHEMYDVTLVSRKVTFGIQNKVILYQTVDMPDDIFRFVAYIKLVGDDIEVGILDSPDVHDAEFPLGDGWVRTKRFSSEEFSEAFGIE